MRQNGAVLFSRALMDLEHLRYIPTYPRSETFGRNMRFLRKGNSIDAFLIQTRSFTEDSRYTIGIIMPALKLANFFVAWMEKEECMYIIPSSFLLNLHSKMEAGDANCYTGKTQWRVDFYPQHSNLRPQLNPQSVIAPLRLSIGEYEYPARQIWQNPNE